MYKKYLVPPELRPRREEPNQVKFGWFEIMSHWDLVLADLHEIYGTDPFQDQSSWLSLRSQIRGLAGHPKSRAWRVALEASQP